MTQAQRVTSFVRTRFRNWFYVVVKQRGENKTGCIVSPGEGTDKGSATSLAEPLPRFRDHYSCSFCNVGPSSG